MVNGENGNIIGVDPILDALADNGGSTQTHLLQAGSPAVDVGNPAAYLTIDQHDAFRPQGASCDIGAVEMDGLSRTAAGGNMGMVAATGGTLLVGLLGLLVWRRRGGSYRYEVC